jgi:hypothetical protein
MTHIGGPIPFTRTGTPLRSVLAGDGHVRWHPEQIRGDGEDLHLLHIFVDADACPVKQEVYRVASRYRLDVTLVANSWMRVPNERRIRRSR